MGSDIPHNPLSTVLHAGGPAPDRADKMMLYGRFIGSWVGRQVIPTAAGPREAPCEVHFGWVLEGRAVQDVWIAPARGSGAPTAAPEATLYGTTLRVYDPEHDHWHITWINPLTQAFNRMTGRQVGDDIVQEYRGDDGERVQWCFTEITADSFHWLARASRDDGATWAMRGEFFLRRANKTQ